MVYVYNLAIKRKGSTPITQMNLENLMSNREAGHKRQHILRFHLYEMLRIGKSYRDKVDWWLPGAEGHSGVAAKGDGLLEAMTCSKLECRDG